MGDKSKPIFSRWLGPVLAGKLSKPYVHILFGARQTGKSTLLRSLLPPDTLQVNLADPRERARHMADPEEFIKLCKAFPQKTAPAYVFVDEAQSVPSLFDAVQYLYDEDKRRWRFILCGSSARRLRRTGANLLPGRSLYHKLHGLTLLERPADMDPKTISPPLLPFQWSGNAPERSSFPEADLLTRLAYGELPGIVLAEERDRADLLETYALVHLEEEIRRESLVKDWGAFLRFLRFAAAESGQILNYAGISQETGLSKPTVAAYYQLLEDMFIGFLVPAYGKSPRKNLLSTPRFYFFDLGVRHASAGLTPSRDIPRVDGGRVFEQWVGLELWKRIQYLGKGQLFHFRTKDGAEIDFVLEFGGTLIPIEVKWTERPSLKDSRHLRSFLAENPTRAPHGYIICRCPRPLALSERITALPWFGF